MISDKIKQLIRIKCLKNTIKHNGQCNPNSVKKPIIKELFKN